MAEVQSGPCIRCSRTDGAAGAAREDAMAVENGNISLLKDAYAAWAQSKGTDCECWMNILSDQASLASLAR